MNLGTISGCSTAFSGCAFSGENEKCQCQAPFLWEGGENQRCGLAGVRAPNRTGNSSPPLGAGLGVGVASDIPAATIKWYGDRVKKYQIMPFGNIYE